MALGASTPVAQLPSAAPDESRIHVAPARREVNVVLFCDQFCSAEFAVRRDASEAPRSWQSTEAA